MVNVWHQLDDFDWLEIVRQNRIDHYVPLVIVGGLDLSDLRVSLDLVVVYEMKLRKLVEREEGVALEAAQKRDERPDEFSETWTGIAEKIRRS